MCNFDRIVRIIFKFSVRKVPLVFLWPTRGPSGISSGSSVTCVKVPSSRDTWRSMFQGRHSLKILFIRWDAVTVMRALCYLVWAVENQSCYCSISELLRFVSVLIHSLRYCESLLHRCSCFVMSRQLSPVATMILSDLGLSTFRFLLFSDNEITVSRTEKTIVHHIQRRRGSGLRWCCQVNNSKCVIRTQQLELKIKKYTVVT